MYASDNLCADVRVSLQEREPLLASSLHTNILMHGSLAKAMAHLLANKMSSRTLLGTQLMRLITDAYHDEPVSSRTDFWPACQLAGKAEASTVIGVNVCCLSHWQLPFLLPRVLSWCAYMLMHAMMSQ